FDAAFGFPVPTLPVPALSAFVDAAGAPPSAARQPFGGFPSEALISKTPPGFVAFVDAAGAPPSAARQPFDAAFTLLGPFFSVTPEGFAAFFDAAGAPPSAARQPFDALWKFPVPAAFVPMRTTFFDAAGAPPSAARM